MGRPPATLVDARQQDRSSFRRHRCRGHGRGLPAQPFPDAHRARIEEVIAERSPLAGAFGIGVLKAFASEYHSLGIASYTTMAGETLSVGAFGMVFVLQSSSRNRK
jgi:hypothetical protein